MELNTGNGIVGVRLGGIRHDNTLSFKGLDIRSRPLTFLRLPSALSRFLTSL